MLRYTGDILGKVILCYVAYAYAYAYEASEDQALKVTVALL